MRSLLPRLFLFCLLWLPLTASAQESLFGPPQGGPPYMAPNRLFSVQLPPGWVPRTFPGKPDFVEIRLLNTPGTAWLQVQRVPVAEGARSRQLMMRAIETRLKVLPHFKELMRREVDFHGVKGSSVLGTFWYQGNAQYPRAIEEIYFVLGAEAFELHFECFQPMSQMLAGELDRVYGSFVPRPPSQSTMPGPNDDAEDPLDKIPF